MSRIYHSAVYTAPDAWRPNRSMVKTSSIPCLDCGAEVGERCKSATGNYVRAHRSRERIATRRANEVTDSRSSTFASSLSPLQRKALRRGVGITQEALAKILGCPTDKVRRLESGKGQIFGPVGSAYGALLRVWQGDAPGR